MENIILGLDLFLPFASSMYMNALHGRAALNLFTASLRWENFDCIYFASGIATFGVHYMLIGISVFQTERKQNKVTSVMHWHHHNDIIYLCVDNTINLGISWFIFMWIQIGNVQSGRHG